MGTLLPASSGFVTAGDRHSDQLPAEESRSKSGAVRPSTSARKFFGTRSVGDADERAFLLQVARRLAHPGELSDCSDARKARSDSNFSGPRVDLSMSMVAFLSVSFQVPNEKFTRVNFWALRLIRAS